MQILFKTDSTEKLVNIKLSIYKYTFSNLKYKLFEVDETNIHEIQFFDKEQEIDDDMIITDYFNINSINIIYVYFTPMSKNKHNNKFIKLDDNITLNNTENIQNDVNEIGSNNSDLSSNDGELGSNNGDIGCLASNDDNNSLYDDDVKSINDSNDTVDNNKDEDSDNDSSDNDMIDFDNIFSNIGNTSSINRFNNMSDDDDNDEEEDKEQEPIISPDNDIDEINKERNIKMAELLADEDFIHLLKIYYEKPDLLNELCKFTTIYNIVDKGIDIEPNEEYIQLINNLELHMEENDIKKILVESNNDLTTALGYISKLYCQSE